MNIKRARYLWPMLLGKNNNFVCTGYPAFKSLSVVPVCAQFGIEPFCSRHPHLRADTAEGKDIGKWLKTDRSGKVFWIALWRRKEKGHAKSLVSINCFLSGFWQTCRKRLLAGVVATLSHLPCPEPWIDMETLKAETSDLLVNQLVNHCCFQHSALRKAVSA